MGNIKFPLHCSKMSVQTSSKGKKNGMFPWQKLDPAGHQQTARRYKGVTDKHGKSGGGGQFKNADD